MERPEGCYADVLGENSGGFGGGLGPKLLDDTKLRWMRLLGPFAMFFAAYDPWNALLTLLVALCVIIRW